MDIKSPWLTLLVESKSKAYAITLLACTDPIHVKLNVNPKDCLYLFTMNKSNSRLLVRSLDSTIASPVSQGLCRCIGKVWTNLVYQRWRYFRPLLQNLGDDVF